MDKELVTRKLNAESKSYFFDIKENKMGLYIKVSEISKGKRSSIIIPQEAWDDFLSEFNGLISDFAALPVDEAEELKEDAVET